MKSKIANKLILYIVLFSSAITLIITAAQLYSEFRHDVSGINNKLEQIKISYQTSVTQSVWVSDKKQLQVILDGITRLADIAYAEVDMGNGGKLQSGSLTGKKSIKLTVPLNYLYDNKIINIGQFAVVATLSGVYQRLLNRLWVILLSNALKTSLVAVFIYFIFVQLVTRHLSKISEFFEKHDPVSNNSRLSLERKAGNNDEFDVVVQSINAMHARLNTQLLEIEQQKQYLSKTLDSIGDAVIATDKDGNITRMNPVAEQLTGWQESEALNKPLKNIFSIVNASTREEIANPIEKVLASGETVYLSNHTTLIAKDGREFQIADSAAPIMSDETILGMVLVFNDVTEQYKTREALRESEERFRQLAENLNEVFWLGSPDWNEVIYVSPAYEDNWGLSKDALYKNARAWLEAVHPDDQQQVINDIPEKLDLSSKVINFREYRIIKPDGEIIWVKARAYPVYNSAGEVIRIAGIAEDITARKFAEETIRRSQKMDALGKLTGGIAHDYNNMLGIIMGYAEHLSDLLHDQPGIQKYADRIMRAGERGSNLTKKLLSFAKYRPADIKNTNINTLLCEEWDMLEKTFTARITLEMKLAENLWNVLLSENDLQDTILNVCINAMHAIDGNGKITIETSNQPIGRDQADQLALEPGDYVQLAIHDTGTGMDEATRQKIFDPFFTTKGVSGTGLGLSQVYGFVKRCKGAIKVDSVPQQGTSFTLYFPRSSENDITLEQADREETIEHDINGNILVVDDEVDLLELIKDVLSKQGFHVYSAESAAKALEILKSEKIDLLVSDIIMPDMDGYALAAIVSQQYPDIKIQLLSGFDDANRDTTDDVTAALARSVLQKPFKAEELLRKVRSLLS